MNFSSTPLTTAVTVLLTILTLPLAAQGPAKKPAPVVPDALRYKLTKAAAIQAQAQLRLEHTPEAQAVTAANQVFQALYAEGQQICGDAYVLQVNADFDPTCMPKVEKK